MKLITSVVAISIALYSVFSNMSCTTSPTGRRQLSVVPDGQMNEMGVQAFNDLKKQQKVSTDAKATAYVKCVANAITTTLPGNDSWEVVLFQDDSANAFALPGHKIGVHTGLLKVAKNQDQLAAVLGHEVGHVLAKHGNERMSEQVVTSTGLAVASEIFKTRGPKYELAMAALGVGAQYGILLPHSRTQESEADVMGLSMMAEAGFNPQQSVDLWKNMASAGGGQPPEFLSTHPSHGTRIDGLQSNMGPAMAKYQAAQSAGRRPGCSL